MTSLDFSRILIQEMVFPGFDIKRSTNKRQVFQGGTRNLVG